MSPELTQALMVIVPTIGGVAIAAINAWTQDRQRKALERAKAAGHTDLMLALGGPAMPTKLPPSGAMVLVLLACCHAVYSLSGGAQYEAKAAPSSRACTSSAQCEPPERCERGRCVADAHRPRPPRFEDIADVALWLQPRSEQRDPFAPLPIQLDPPRDVLWLRELR